MSTAGRIAFTYPNFRAYMTARFLVTASSEMQSVAVGWQVYALTRRPLDLGLVGLAQFLPGILLFLVAGHTADRLARQRIIQVCFAGFGLCSALLLLFAWRGEASVYPIYGVLVLNGVTRAFHGPASQAFLPLLVEECDFPNAVTWSSSIFQSATVLGPAAGGLIYGALAGPSTVYALAAVNCVISSVLVSRLRLPARQKPPNAARVQVILEGLRYIFRHELILGAISLDLFAVLLGGAVALLPVFARTILGVGPMGMGVMRSAPGAGAVLMATLLAYRPLRRRAGAAMLWCVCGFGVFTIVFGLSRSLPLTVAALLLVGACDMVSVVVRHTMIQLGTPDEMRGRVSAVNMVFIGASNEVGQFESGLTAQWWGAAPAVVIGGIGTIAVVAAWARWFPALRRVDQLTPHA